MIMRIIKYIFTGLFLLYITTGCVTTGNKSDPVNLPAVNYSQK